MKLDCELVLCRRLFETIIYMRYGSCNITMSIFSIFVPNNGYYYVVITQVAPFTNMV